MNLFNVSDLKDGISFTSDVVLDKSFLLSNSSIPITDLLIKALNDWGFTQVFSDGTIQGSGSRIIVPPPQEPEKTVNPALKISVPVKTNSAVTEQNRLDMVQGMYQDYITYIATVYTRFVSHKELKLHELSKTVNELCSFIKENRRYVLRITHDFHGPQKDFLIYHSMRSTVLAIAIGFQMKFPLSKLIELGVACILHELGMVKLPPQLYMNDRPLSAIEKKSILTHPIFSYDILKSYEFPMSISIAALEHHEKEDGSGYPRKITGDRISMYAKIIAVVCSFEAITASRRYKEAQSAHDGMVEMLKNMGKHYDETVIKALLYAISLFPIGSYVYLSDGKVGLVIDTNPEDPKNPIVQLVGNAKNGEDEQIIKTSSTGIKIVRALTKNETKDILDSVKAVF